MLSLNLHTRKSLNVEYVVQTVIEIQRLEFIKNKIVHIYCNFALKSLRSRNTFVFNNKKLNKYTHLGVSDATADVQYKVNTLSAYI